MNFENLQQVRDYINKIPERDFCTKHLSGEVINTRCVSGHLNIALHGNVFWRWDSVPDGPKDMIEVLLQTDTGKMLSKFEVNLIELMNANNEDTENPKRGALKYLDSILSKN